MAVLIGEKLLHKTTTLQMKKTIDVTKQITYEKQKEHDTGSLIPDEKQHAIEEESKQPMQKLVRDRDKDLREAEYIDFAARQKGAKY